MKATINVGIIGCGGISAFAHVPELLLHHHSVRIKYLCDENLSRAEKIKERYSLSLANCVTAIKNVIEDESVDAVIVATWPASNLKVAVEAIRFNKHLLVQKPLIGSSEDLESLQTLVNGSDKQILFLPYIEEVESFKIMKDIINENMLGEVSFVKIRTSISGPENYCHDVKQFFDESDQAISYMDEFYAKKRGCISDMGPYALAAYHFLLGEGELAFCNYYPSEFERTAQLSLNSKDKTKICSIEIGWSQMMGLEVCCVYGSNGTATIKPDGEVILLLKTGESKICYSTSQNPTKPVVLPLSPFDAQNLWIKSILSDNHKLTRTIDSAIWVSKIIESAYKFN